MVRPTLPDPPAIATTIKVTVKLVAVNYSQGFTLVVVHDISTFGGTIENDTYLFTYLGR
jgi:hypothetical protein